MPKLVLNYMRPMAMLLLFSLSIAILSSFIFIPKSLVFALPDFYHRYWHLLSAQLAIAILFVIMAFYAERKPNAAHWFYHIIALAFLGSFVVETYRLFEIGGILFAFIN